MNSQRIITPAGNELVVLAAQEFQDLIDARDAAMAMADVRSGRTDLLSETELDRIWLVRRLLRSGVGSAGRGGSYLAGLSLTDRGRSSHWRCRYRRAAGEGA